MFRHSHDRTVPTRPPVPSFMTPEQVDHYLADLRSYKPPRPSGARPLGSGVNERPSQVLEIHRGQSTVPAPPRRQSVDAAKRLSTTSRHSMNLSHLHHGLGHEGLAPSAGDAEPAYSIPYYERGQRWMERQEAQSLTRALREMDVSKEDPQVYAAAQEEAAKLVWKHQHPNAAYRNPEYDYRLHLRKGSHARSQSIGPFQELHVRKRNSGEAFVASDQGSRKVSSGSNGSNGTKSSRSSRSTVESVMDSLRGLRHSRSGSLRDRARANFPLNGNKVRGLSDRRSGGKGSRKASDESAKTPFANPEDKIYEELEDIQEKPRAELDDTQRPLRVKARNTSYGNSTSGVRFKNGIEVRSDDIRAATSMKRKDRSPNLPQPSVVSDRPGRPIVSFDPEYYPPKPSPAEKKDADTASRRTSDRITPAEQRNPQATSVLPHPTFQTDGVPSISISADIPTISPPTITVDEPEFAGANPAVKPKAQISTGPSSRPLPSHTSAFARRSHWSPAYQSRPQAQCAACALGIQGKVVSAANQRFHPHCFTCYHCGELLECVAFYPEPEEARAERLRRHDSLMQGELLHDDPVNPVREEDGDPGLRFYCHLDFHEKFSPRCRSCKTPIEGKVVVACGGEWHEGHFFCAQCGDPFDQTTPFIEKEGYAWCVPCHTKRFSGKCAGCRKPVIDMVINALGKEWHEQCFCCQECGSLFEDGRFFTHEGDDKPVCVKCEERRLKA